MIKKANLSYDSMTTDQQSQSLPDIRLQYEAIPAAPSKSQKYLGSIKTGSRFS
jgi:hypothetical protein